ncbi:hypothetical protein BH11ACT5_BH11ACT5_09400 [soil metagenome]
MRRIAAGLILSTVTVAALSGCIFVRPNMTSPSTVPTSGSLQVCDGVDFTVTGVGFYTLQGDCGVVTVTGNDITIKADDAEAIVIKGDRVNIEMGSLGRLDLEGNDNELDADDIGGVNIAGDRNTVDADTSMAVTIQGNDNVVDADITGDVVQSGDRNLVGSR